MSRTIALDRRGFLRRASGRHRSMTLPCGRLYIRYVDAIGADRLAAFVTAVEAEIGSANEVRLIEREWLADDDFRQTMETILSTCSSDRRRSP